MSDLFANPRVRELLRQADAGQRLAEDLSAAKESTADVEAALKAIYADLGRAAHQAWREAMRGATPSIAPAVERDQLLPTDTADVITGESDFTDQIEDEGGESWYTDEVGGDRAGTLGFAHGSDDHTDIPESDPLLDGGTDTSSRGREDDDTIATLAAIDGGDRESGVWELRNAQPTWEVPLRKLLELLGSADPPTTPDQLAVEASRVQWATSDLEIRIGSFPEDVQTALVALLSARARHLEDRLDVGIGPRLAVDRLRRYRIGHRLRDVAGIAALPMPERGTWAADARAWWELLMARSPR